MKKKYRDITVGGKQYAWMVNPYKLTIWQNKKVLTTVDVRTLAFPVTPELVEEVIKNCNIPS